MLPNNTLLQGRYRIVEQIGRGGMGAVYKAIDTRLQATVALKQTTGEGEPLRKAFEREAQLLASLHHPSLPHVSDHFIDDYGQFLVMEYIPGDDLGALLLQRAQPFDVDAVLDWADQLLEALDYLHTRTPPIIHRDIKPQNLKLTERQQVVLLDFGLAKGAIAQTRVTSTGSIFGYTPHYAPLEQINGIGTDARSDLYALAATLYHLLTAQVPVDAMTRATAIINGQADPLAPIRTINPLVPPAVAAVLHQTLAQAANQRPESAVAMRALLRDAERESHSARGVATEIHSPDQNATLLDTPNGQARPAPRSDPRQASGPPPWRMILAAIGGAALLVLLALFALRAAGANSLLAQIGSASSTAVASDAAAIARALAPTPDAANTALSIGATGTSTAQAAAALLIATRAQTATALPTAAPAPTALATDQPTPLPQPTTAPTPTAVPPSPVPPATATAEPPRAATAPPAAKQPDPPTPLVCDTQAVRGFGKVLQEHQNIVDRLGCPVEGEQGSEGTEQPFEHGSMIWFKQSDRFYILTGGQSGSWFGLSGGDIRDKPPIPEQVPAGKYAPGAPQDFREDDGFARVWSNIERGRALGWGTNVEAYFPGGAYQRFTHGTMIFTPSGLGNGKMIWVLFDDGGFVRYRDTFEG